VNASARCRFAVVLVFAATLGVHGNASAQSPSAPPPEAAARYSLPWQLRPVTIEDAARIDSVAAVFNDENGNLDLAAATVLAISHRINRDWAPMLRLAFVGNNAPGAAFDGTSFANPLIGVTHARTMGCYRVALFGATTIPVGTGGGNTLGGAAAKTNAESATARPADLAMFAVNYLTEIVGVDYAYVGHGFTAQAEATLQQLVRVRGSASAAATDAFRTHSAVGLHLGYFIGSHFSLGADLRYQRWLSHPTARNLATGAKVPLSDDELDAVTFAGGPRLHFKLGKQAGIHPGLSFVRGLNGQGLDATLVTAQATGVQIDLPLTF
jgi:hypothetical protein